MIYKLLPTRVYRAYYGGKNIDQMTGVENPESTRFPEDWLASVTVAFNPGRDIPDEGLSKTVEGDYLKDIIEQNKDEMIGNRETMSLLFKLLDADERLVIQVHPTVEFAKKHFDSQYGKTECWYILNDGGYVYIGFKAGITKEYMMKLFETQDTEAMLSCMHRFEVKKGDFIFVAGGVPHAIGEGCFMAELQEPTDLMVIPERITPSGVRLADEKLHCGLGFEKMFDCFEYNGMTREETREKFFLTPYRINDGEKVIVDESITDKFRLSEIETDGEYKFNLSSYAIAIVIDGEGSIGCENIKKGDRLFISESEGGLKIRGKMKILICRP